MLGKRYISFDTEYLLPSSGHHAELHFLDIRFLHTKCPRTSTRSIIILGSIVQYGLRSYEQENEHKNFNHDSAILFALSALI